ncbi:KaiC domain-containing protein [Archaeoglobales archaeon]|nr:MAG: KaiC domain-containing protein [Archaeoglobales archaeon]
MKVSTGIEGIDSIIGGGIPEGHIVTIFGTYGTGKTTFGLHFVYQGLRSGENCIYISLDEDEDSILDTASGFGMDLSNFQENLEIIRLDPVAVKESLEKIRSEMLQAIMERRAKRLVVDTISVLEGLFDEKERWIPLSYLRNIIKKSGVTAILTSEADKTQLSSKYGILEYISDGAVALRYLRKTEIEEPVLALEVVKMRRVKHSRKLTPYIITDKGIEVLEGAELF